MVSFEVSTAMPAQDAFMTGSILPGTTYGNAVSPVAMGPGYEGDHETALGQRSGQVNQHASLASHGVLIAKRLLVLSRVKNIGMWAIAKVKLIKHPILSDTTISILLKLEMLAPILHILRCLNLISIDIVFNRPCIG